MATGWGLELKAQQIEDEVVLRALVVFPTRVEAMDKADKEGQDSPMNLEN